MAKRRAKVGQRSLTEFRKPLALARTRYVGRRLPSTLSSLQEGARGLFHWTGSNVIFVLWPLVPTMVSVGDFGLAYAFAVSALFWTLGSIVTEEHISTRKTRVLGIVVAIIIFYGAWSYVAGKKMNMLLASHVGVLMPGSSKTPPNFCGPDVPGTVTFILGTMEVRTSIFPSTIVSVRGKPLLTVDRTPDGEMLLSADIYDDEDKIVAEINKSQYHVDPSVFEMRRTSLSNLSVVIRKNKEKVLDVDCLNPQTVSIAGVFRADYTKVEVSKEGIVQDGSSLGTVASCALYTQGEVQTLFDFARQ